MRARLVSGIAAGTLALVALAATLPGLGHADTAQLSVLHGVPDLTVDVWVNGERTLDDFTPGSLAGPLDLPAGTYTVAITAADATDASSPAIGPVDLALEAGKNYTAVAHLDARGRPDRHAVHQRHLHDGARARVGSPSGTSPRLPRSTSSPARRRSSPT